MKGKTDFGEVMVSGLNYYGSVENQHTKQTSFVSPPCKGDALVHRASGQHTIQIHTINFNGNISIEGTLDRYSNTGAWLPVQLTNTMTSNVATDLGYIYTIPVPGVPYSGKTIELNQFFIATGQYAWLRANISNISNGIVDSIKLSF